MSTQQERQRVADWYRGLADEVGEWGEANPWWYVMKGAYGDVARHDTNDLFRRLADLIDPTCTFGPARDACGNLELHGAIYPDRCSACGQMFIAGEPYRYCPNCGARIEWRKVGTNEHPHEQE